MKKILVVGLIFALVLMSGCIKIVFRENIGADGISTFVMTLEAVNKTASGDDSKTDPCKDIKQDNPRVTDVKCTYDKVNQVITLTGKINRIGTKGLSMMGGRYRLNVKQALNDMNGDDKTSGTKTTLPDTDQKKQMEELRKTGFVYDYYVKLPGRVVSQKGGVQQLDGSVKFDMIDTPEDAYVESDASAVDAASSILQNNALDGKCCCMPMLSFLLAGVGALLVKI
ncbi:MAG: hypothetical protein KKD39_03925 [Candidatus Altiarchaeota archaeon]|nr:hypothetical protein [Candidatus Altiarchaeota archaeon]